MDQSKARLPFRRVMCSGKILAQKSSHGVENVAAFLRVMLVRLLATSHFHPECTTNQCLRLKHWGTALPKPKSALQRNGEPPPPPAPPPSLLSGLNGPISR